jgi:coproporphyrinogen III oxidase-like Fe-S oxidoreductase
MKRSPPCALRSRVFDRSSFDLIYSRPRQTLDDWEDELKEALWLAEGAYQLYQLTIEQGTRYFDLFTRRQAEDARRRPERRFLRDDAGADGQAGSAGL